MIKLTGANDSEAELRICSGIMYYESCRMPTVDREGRPVAGLTKIRFVDGTVLLVREDCQEIDQLIANAEDDEVALKLLLNREIDFIAERDRVENHGK